MPPVLTVAPGLRAWTLTLENGQTRTVLASSMDAAVSGTFASPIVGATRGAAYTPATPPVLASLTPASAQIGAANFTLHAIGTGFQSGDVIIWNGSPEPTTFVSATELTTGVNMATAQVPMAIPVAVRNVGGLDSNVVTFDLQPAAGAEE